MTGFRTIELSDPAISADGLRFATVKSAALGQRADICFYVPPEAEGATDVPLVLLLHGVYGSHWAWALKGGAHRTAARLIGAGVLPPVVLAMPSDGLWGDGSGYVSHGAQDFERWIMDEVSAAAVEAIEGCTARSPLMVAGLSMGGFAALRLAGKYPRRIAAAAAHSAVTDVTEMDALIEESRAGWSELPEDRNVLAAVTRAVGPLPPLRFDCGLSDPFLAGNRALHEALERAGIDHIYREAEGGHEWPYWSRELEQTFRFFADVLSAREG
jgi:putative tributyrin esterase